MGEKYPATKARLDEDKTAKPLTQIIGTQTYRCLCSYCVALGGNSHQGFHNSLEYVELPKEESKR